MKPLAIFFKILLGEFDWVQWNAPPKKKRRKWLWSLLLLLPVLLYYTIRMRWYSPYGVIVYKDTRIVTSQGYIRSWEITGHYTPSLSEVNIMEKRLRTHMTKMYCQGTKYNFTDYYFEYVGFLHRGHKSIYVKALYARDSHVSWLDWHWNHTIAVYDGGPVYFNTEYDVASGRFVHTWFNGPLMIDAGECGVK